MSIKKCSFYLQNADLLVHSDHKPLLKNFPRHTDNDKCNTWGLEVAAFPRRVKVQHIKGIANTLANLVSRLRAVGLYHDIDSEDYQQELSVQFELLLPVEPTTHTPLEVSEVLIAPNIKNFMPTYDELHDFSTGQNNGNVKLSLENMSPTDIPQFEQNLMSLLELKSEKVAKVQKNNTFCKNIIQHIDYSRHNSYFIDTTEILHKEVMAFNSTFSAIATPQIS